MNKGIVIYTAAIIIGFLMFSEPVNAQQKQEIILAGYKHKPPVATTGSGMLTVTFKNDTLTIDGSFKELTSQYSGAYLMVSLRGQSGNQLYNLRAELNEQKTGGTFMPTDNKFALSRAEIQLLKKGELYINISSFDNQNGELRGNISAIN